MNIQQTLLASIQLLEMDAGDPDLMSIALPGYIRKVWAKRVHKAGISKFCATLFKERKAMP